MRYSRLHGLTWEQLADQPSFAQVWSTLAPSLGGSAFLVAHNAAFDRNVLDACCRAAGVAAPQLPFFCTAVVARAVWGLHPADLPTVCRRLGLPLRHHRALSDAEASARILLAACPVPISDSTGTVVALECMGRPIRPLPGRRAPGRKHSARPRAACTGPDPRACAPDRSTR